MLPNQVLASDPGHPPSRWDVDRHRSRTIYTAGQTWWTTQHRPKRHAWTRGPCNFPATSATVEVLENGPLRAKIKVSYVALRPRWCDC